MEESYKQYGCNFKIGINEKGVKYYDHEQNLISRDDMMLRDDQGNPILDREGKPRGCQGRYTVCFEVPRVYFMPGDIYGMVFKMKRVMFEPEEDDEAPFITKTITKKATSESCDDGSCNNGSGNAGSGSCDGDSSSTPFVSASVATLAPAVSVAVVAPSAPAPSAPAPSPASTTPPAAASGPSTQPPGGAPLAPATLPADAESLDDPKKSLKRKNVDPVDDKTAKKVRKA
jgi:hypothetical protein